MVPARRRRLSQIRTAPARRAPCERSVLVRTEFLLLAQYNGLAVIPLEWVCRDYFRHLTPEKFLRKVLTAEISIPVVRIEGSQKCAKGIHVNDLAAYLDRQTELARKECEQLRPHAA